MEAVFETIASLDLPLISDKSTLGGGNCLFHALIQQGHRQTVMRKSGGNHEHLRRSICDFALNATHPDVLTMKQNFDTGANDDGSPLWEEFFTNMMKKGVWADGPVLPVAALYLGYNVYVVSPGNNQCNPWLEIPGGDGAELKDPIILGNAPGLHYQSLLPLDGFAAWQEKNKKQTNEKSDVDTADNKIVDPMKHDTLITSTPSKQTPFTPSKHQTPNIKSVPPHSQELDVTKIIERVRRRCQENINDLNLLVRENRRLRSQKRSLSFKLDVELKKKVPKVMVMDLDASLDASIFEGNDDVDDLLFSFEV